MDSSVDTSGETYRGAIVKNVLSTNKTIAFYVRQCLFCSVIVAFTLFGAGQNAVDPIFDVPGTIMLASIGILIAVISVLVVGLLIRTSIERPVKLTTAKNVLRWFLIVEVVFLLISLYAAATTITGIKDSVLPEVEMNIVDRLYFSVITFTTVGYGDMVPMSKLGRALSAMEALSGYFVLGLSISAMTKQAMNWRSR